MIPDWVGWLLVYFSLAVSWLIYQVRRLHSQDAQDRFRADVAIMDTFTAGECVDCKQRFPLLVRCPFDNVDQGRCGYCHQHHLKVTHDLLKGAHA